MKKQFFRVKQLADQTFSRAGKTEVLCDDLQVADRKVEYIKTSCQSVGKKLSACLLLGQLQGESATKEKVLKKSPEYQLGSTMIECSNLCDEDSLMKVIFNKCGHTERLLAEENAEHDSLVEQLVVTPLQNVAENDIPSIVKHKRNVTKVCLDMDSAKARYHQAQKHNANNTAGAAKVDAIKDELEDCELKVEQSRDILACEMFNLAAKESDLCHIILQYYKLQKAYHESALHTLDKLIPELEDDVCSSSIKPVYGTSIEEHLRVTKRKIAFPIELCVCALLELGMEEEGLFRIAGGVSKVKRMKLSFNAGCMNLSTALAYRDPHVIAGALKSYLRELPEPLLTHDLYDEWLNAAKAQIPIDNKLQALWTVFHKLPQSNFDNLGYLIKFFHALSKNQDINKMTPHNIAIVIAPSLIWAKQDNDASNFGLNMNATALYTSIIDHLVNYADWFFDKEMDFYVTLEPVMNGEMEERLTDKGIDSKGIDNKGFDIKAADKTGKSSEKTHSRNHSGGDNLNDAHVSEMKRSQSISSLSDDLHDSPKPITRRKNKSAAPVPPGVKDAKKKEDVKTSKDHSPVSNSSKEQKITNQIDRPDKPPRPNVPATSTLPRPAKSGRENKSTETNRDDAMTQSVGSIGFEKFLRHEQNAESNDRQEARVIRKEKVQKATVSTNTESTPRMKENYQTGSLERRAKERPVAAPRSVTSTIEIFEKEKQEDSLYSKLDLTNMKKEWLLGKDNSDAEGVVLRKPAVPERPSTLKSHALKTSRNSLEISSRNNYENVSLSSNENLSGGSSDERTLQRTQMYSIDKQQVSIIHFGNEEKEKERSSKEKEKEPSSEMEKEDNSDTECVVLRKRPEKEKQKDKDGDKEAPPEIERKNSVSATSKPMPLPVAEKPERPPKPEFMSSTSPSSHNRTFSDGQIIDIKPRDTTISNSNHNNSNININNNNNNVSESSASASGGVKHPRTSPPPPPVPAKPRANSQSESTDF